MTLRYLVPSLGLLAVAAHASAATGESFHVGGYVDSILNLSRNVAPTNSGATAKNDKDAKLDFTTTAEIRLTGKIGQDVSVRVELEFNNGDSTADNNAVDLGQAYANYAFAKDWSWTMGKFTSYLGWVAHDSDGLYRVNGGIIPSLYGSDLQGTTLNWQINKEWKATFAVVNGFGFGDGADNLNASGIGNGRTGGKISANRSDSALGVGFDILGGATDGAWGQFNLEAAFDFQNGTNGGGASGTNGDVFQIGANYQITLPSYKDLMLAAELIYRSNSKSANGSDDKSKDAGILLAAQHKIPKSMKPPFPMAVTAMYQKVGTDISNDVNDKQWENEYSVALLTNPTGTDQFGVNLEFFIRSFDGKTASDNSWGAAFEVLAVLP